MAKMEAVSEKIESKNKALVLEAFDTLFSINVRGTFFSMKYEIPHLLAAGKGSIINLASTAALAAPRRAVRQSCRPRPR